MVAEQFGQGMYSAILKTFLYDQTFQPLRHESRRQADRDGHHPTDPQRPRLADEQEFLFGERPTENDVLRGVVRDSFKPRVSNQRQEFLSTRFGLRLAGQESDRVLDPF